MAGGASSSPTHIPSAHTDRNSGTQQEQERGPITFMHLPQEIRNQIWELYPDPVGIIDIAANPRRIPQIQNRHPMAKVCGELKREWLAQCYERYTFLCSVKVLRIGCSGGGFKGRRVQVERLREHWERWVEGLRIVGEGIGEGEGHWGSVRKLNFEFYWFKVKVTVLSVKGKRDWEKRQKVKAAAPATTVEGERRESIGSSTPSDSPPAPPPPPMAATAGPSLMLTQGGGVLLEFDLIWHAPSREFLSEEDGRTAYMRLWTAFQRLEAENGKLTKDGFMRLGGTVLNFQLWMASLGRF